MLPSAGLTSNNGNTEDGALYTVDHLATFTVGESYGKEIKKTKDGIQIGHLHRRNNI
jgi:hypothetical protein